MNNPTKTEFIENVIGCWLAGATIGMAMNRTFNSTEVLDAQVKYLHDMFPRGVKKNVHFMESVKTWLARNYKNASDCMFDGDYEKAKKWMLSGKDVDAITKKSHRLKEATKEFGKRVHPGERRTA